LAELEIPQLDPNRAFSYSADLFHAYAEVLDELGREEQAAQWRARAARAEQAFDQSLADDELETIDIVEEDIAFGDDDSDDDAGDAEVEFLDDSEPEPEPEPDETDDPDGEDEPRDGTVSTEQ